MDLKVVAQKKPLLYDLTVQIDQFSTGIFIIEYDPLFVPFLYSTLIIFEYQRKEVDHELFWWKILGKILFDSSSAFPVNS